MRGASQIVSRIAAQHVTVNKMNAPKALAVRTVHKHAADREAFVRRDVPFVHLVQHVVRRRKRPNFGHFVHQAKADEVGRKRRGVQTPGDGNILKLVPIEAILVFKC